MKFKDKTLPALCLTLALALSCAGCGAAAASPGASPAVAVSGANIADAAPAATAAPLADPVEEGRTAEGSFSVSAAAGGSAAEQSGAVWTIRSAGEYTLSGALENGQIVVDAGDDDEVVLILEGVSVTSADAAPILVLNAGEVTVKAAEGSYNTVSDLRSGDAENEEYDAAIWAACDLKLRGKGTLIVTSDYDCGVKSKDDLSVKNLTLKVSAPGAALKGNDSVTVESGALLLISTAGDGIKTSNSDVSSKGKQRGTVSLLGGQIDVYAAGDGISAAYNVELAPEEDCALNIFTGSYAAAAGLDGVRFSSGESSAKGVKAENEVIISGGTVSVSSEDDGIHANADEELENGARSVGNITVTDGSVTVTSGDDGMHADGTLRISGGSVHVEKSHEGLEANIIEIEGGSVYVWGDDDGLNARKGSATPQINISGGYIEVATPAGDTDAIDSNGSFTMRGGFVLVRGGAGMGGMAGSLDTDRGATVTGGTIVALGGISTVPGGESVNTWVSAGTSLSAGDYTLTDSAGSTVVSFTLEGSYNGVWIASDALTLGETYTLSRGGSQVAQWTQSSAMEGSAGFGGMGGMGGFGGRGGMGNPGAFGGRRG